MDPWNHPQSDENDWTALLALLILFSVILLISCIKGFRQNESLRAEMNNRIGDSLQLALLFNVPFPRLLLLILFGAVEFVVAIFLFSKAHEHSSYFIPYYIFQDFLINGICIITGTLLIIVAFIPLVVFPMRCRGISGDSKTFWIWNTQFETKIELDQLLGVEFLVGADGRTRAARCVKKPRTRRHWFSIDILQFITKRRRKTSETVPRPRIIIVRPARHSPSNQSVFDAWEAWLTSRGVPTSHRQLATNHLDEISQISLWGEILFLPASIFLSFTLGFCGMFWIAWYFFGNLNMVLLYFWRGLWFFLTILLFYLSPIRSWFWKTIQWIGSLMYRDSRDNSETASSSLPSTGFSVLLRDEYLVRQSVSDPQLVFGIRPSGALLDTDGDSLILRAPELNWKISREDVLEISRPRFWKRIYDGSIWIYPSQRFSGRPIVLRWRLRNDAKSLINVASSSNPPNRNIPSTTEGALPTECGVVISSHGGSSFGADRRLDSRLFDALQLWRDGESLVPFLSSPCLQPRSLCRAPLFLSLFFIPLFLAPFVHNHLLNNYVSNGVWRSSLRHPKQPCDIRFPVVQSLDGKSLIYLEPLRGLFNRWWIRDCKTGEFTLVDYDFANLLDQPHPSSYWVTNYPTIKRFRFPIGQSRPPSVLLTNITTGRSRPLPHKPFDDVSFGNAALWRDEKLFYTHYDSSNHISLDSIDDDLEIHSPFKDLRIILEEFKIQIEKKHNPTASYLLNKVSPLPSNTKTTTTNINCYSMHLFDMKTHLTKDLGRFESLNLPDPVFFPDGRRVLCGWTVVDTETGHTQSLQLPPGFSPQTYFFNRSFRTFSCGPTLRFPVYYTMKDQTFSQVWEIDPENPEIRILEDLGPTQTLIGAEGDRWLLASVAPDNNISIILYNFHTGTRREVLREQKWRFHFLLSGEDAVLSVDTEGLGRELTPLPRE